MANVESLMILSGITIISGVSLWMLNKKQTPKKRSPTPKKRSPKRSPTPEESPINEIKTPLPTIRKTPPKSPKVIVLVRSPKVKTVSPKVKTVVRSPKVKTVSPKVKTPKAKTPKAKTVPINQPAVVTPSPVRETPEPRVKFGRTTRPILKRTRRRLSDNSISSTNATIHTEVTDRNNL